MQVNQFTVESPLPGPFPLEANVLLPKKPGLGSRHLKTVLVAQNPQKTFKPGASALA